MLFIPSYKLSSMRRVVTAENQVALKSIVNATKPDSAAGNTANANNAKTANRKTETKLRIYKDKTNDRMAHKK